MHDFGGDLKKRWYIDYYQNGERQRKWITSRPLETRAARAKKTFKEISKLFFSKTEFDFEAILDKKELVKKSRQTYKSDIKILSEYFPNLNLIDPFEFKEYLIDTYARNTVRNKIKNLKSVFTTGVQEGFLKENPFDKIKSVSPDNDSDQYFPFSEYERSILEPELQKNKKLFLFTRFVYYTFSRIQELKNLKVGDINLRARTITLRIKGGRTVVKPILDPLLDFIIESKVLMNPSNYYVFGKDLETSPIRCQMNLATTLHREALKEVGLYREDETSLYGWKHTGCVEAYMAGMDIRLIQQMCAHRSILTTEIYLRKLGLWLQKEAYKIRF